MTGDARRDMFGAAFGDIQEGHSAPAAAYGGGVQAGTAGR